MSHYKPFDRIRNQIKRKYKYKETKDLNLCQKVLITYQGTNKIIFNISQNIQRRNIR